MGRKGLLSRIHTSGQKERTAYLFKTVTIYYENMPVLHSLHRLRSHIHIWCKKQNTCRNSKFKESIFCSCICLQLSRTPKHILHTKDLKIPRFFLLLLLFCCLTASPHSPPPKKLFHGRNDLSFLKKQNIL